MIDMIFFLLSVFSMMNAYYFFHQSVDKIVLEKKFLVWAEGQKDSNPFFAAQS